MVCLNLECGFIRKLFRLNFHLNRIFYIQIWKTTILLHDVYGFEMNFTTNVRPCFFFSVGDFPFSCVATPLCCIILNRSKSLVESFVCVVNMFRVIEPKIHTHTYLWLVLWSVCVCERWSDKTRFSQSQNRHRMMEFHTLCRFSYYILYDIIATQCKS